MAELGMIVATLSVAFMVIVATSVVAISDKGGVAVTLTLSITELSTPAPADEVDTSNVVQLAAPAGSVDGSRPPGECDSNDVSEGAREVVVAMTTGRCRVTTTSSKTGTGWATRPAIVCSCTRLICQRIVRLDFWWSLVVCS